MTKRNYLLALANYAHELFDKLPLEKEPQPLKHTLGVLKTQIETLKTNELQRLTTIRPDEKIGTPGNKNNWQGLNSIGMLMDRFTILLIREWCLKNKSNPNPEKAAIIFEQQTLDIIEAMVNAAPGSASLNSKITNIKSSVYAQSWEETFYGILTINLILWESQEVLYIKDIQSLPSEELREYISWFSKGNIIRNEYIQLCEEFFWKI